MHASGGRFRAGSATAIVAWAAIMYFASVDLGRAQTGDRVCGEAGIVAYILSLSGEVRVADRPATTNSTVCGDDTVEIGAGSRARVQVVGAEVPLTLKANTHMRIPRQPRSDESLLELIEGALYFLGRVRHRVTVETTIVTYGIQGTEFHLEVAADSERLILFEGEVSTRAADGTELTRARTAQMIDTGSDGRPAVSDLDITLGRYAPLRVAARDTVAWTIYYPPILDAALNLDPSVAEASAFLATGQVNEAISALARAPVDGPSAAVAEALRAIIAVSQGDNAEAMARSEAAMALAPGDPAVVIARSYALQGRFELDAARDLLRAAVTGPAADNALTWARLAELELTHGRSSEARVAASRAVELADIAQTQMVLGFAELSANDTSSALQRFDRALELDSELPLAWLGKGLARIKRGFLVEGRRYLELALSHDPSSALIRSYLGKAYLEEQSDEKAFTQFEMAKELDPADPTPHFYDAIALQQANRPVEALRALEEAIARNDNRAVYRSRLLLDQDRATRGVNLARIYRDLGLDELAFGETSRSLALDPANPSAHRFLSEIYSNRRRHDIARVSEDLKAQLLQPLAITPVHPHRVDSDTSIISSTSPRTMSATELTRTFDRDGITMAGSGFVGNHDSWAEEVVLAGMFGHTAFSLGQFRSDTNGFRNDLGIENELYDVFVQVEPNDRLSVQAEFFRRETDDGDDLTMRFDEANFVPGFAREVRSNRLRIGAHAKIRPGLDALLSVAHGTRDEKQTFMGFERSTRDRGPYLEGQLIGTTHLANFTLGGGFHYVNVRQAPFGGVRQRREREFANGYGYADIPLGEKLIATLGAGVERYNEGGLEVSETLPKMGLQWTPLPAIDLRAAFFGKVKRALVVEPTLEPSTIAGFNQLYDDLNGTRSYALGVGVDYRPTKALSLGAEALGRSLNVPVLTAQGYRVEEQKDIVGSAYAAYVVDDNLTTAIRYNYDRVRSASKLRPNTTVRRLDTHHVPLTATYNHSNGLFGEATANFVHQNVERRVGNAEGESNFVTFDASLGWKFQTLDGQFQFEAINLLDEQFDFQDDSFRSSEIRAPEFVPSREFFFRLNLRF